MKCYYCTKFYYSDVRDTIIIGKKIEYQRYCPSKDDLVFSEDFCGKFTTHPFFWCKKNDYWIDLSVCLMRYLNQKEIYEGCGRCSQGKEVIRVSKLSKPKILLIKKVLPAAMTPPGK